MTIADWINDTLATAPRLTEAQAHRLSGLLFAAPALSGGGRNATS